MRPPGYEHFRVKERNEVFNSVKIEIIIIQQSAQVQAVSLSIGYHTVPVQ